MTASIEPPRQTPYAAALFDGFENARRKMFKNSLLGTLTAADVRLLHKKESGTGILPVCQLGGACAAGYAFMAKAVEGHGTPRCWRADDGWLRFIMPMRNSEIVELSHEPGRPLTPARGEGDVSPGEGERHWFMASMRDTVIAEPPHKPSLKRGLFCPPGAHPGLPANKNVHTPDDGPFTQ